MRRKLSLIFFFLGLANCITSFIRYSIRYIPATYEFGLIQVLPPWFWFGFAVCLLSLLEGINRDKESVFFTKSLLLVMLIWNIPTLLLSHPYEPGSYMHIFEATPIMLSGHVPPASETLHWVFNLYPVSFPGYHILLTSVFQVTNVAPLDFAKYYPLFSSAVTFLAIWLFFKTFLPSAGYRWALLVAILANVYMQLHLSPQSVGLVAGLLTLVALEKDGWPWKVIALLLFAFLIISHPTMTIIILLGAGLAWLLRMLLVRDRKTLLEPVPLLVIGWIAWSMLYAVPFQQSVTELATTAPTVPTVPIALKGPIAPATGIVFLDIFISETWKRLYGVFYWAPRIRFVILGVFGIGSVYYLVRQWLNKASRSQRLLITYTAFLIAPVIMTLIDITILRAGQLHDRYFLFFLLITPIVLISLAERTGHSPLTNAIQNLPLKCSVSLRNVFPLALVFLALFNFTTIYYQSSLFIASDETISASEFVNSNTSSQVIGGEFVPDLADPYQSAILRQSRFYHLYPQPLSSLALPSVIVFDDHSRL